MSYPDWNMQTPVQVAGGYLFKRDDLFRPFKGLNVNGGKLRQCLEVVSRSKPERLVSYSSIYSPQLGIVSSVGQHYSIPVNYLVGGNKETEYTNLAQLLGAKLIRKSCARESCLLAEARKMAGPGSMIIKSGMGDMKGIYWQVNATARQMENVPANVGEIILTCGSGLTAIGIIKGIQDYRKKIERLILICTAPDRTAFIHTCLEKIGVEPGSIRLKCIDLYDPTGNEYRVKMNFGVGGILFHPQYEAKAFAWAFENLAINKKATLFWIVGAQIL